MRVLTISTILLSLALLSGCKGYQDILKSDNTELKYEKAMEYYEEKDYYKAIQLLDNLRSVTRGTKRAEEVSYYYAQAHYKNEEYILASYYFKNFVKNFPKSDKKEKALYLSAYCKYMQAPPYYLDQSTTKEAINDLQYFANTYPQSEYIVDVNKHINELKKRIEKKEINKANLYYKMENWKAAAYAFEVFLDKYPVSKYREEAMFKIANAKFNYAKNSVSSKQPDRYRKVVEAADEFLAEYAESEYKEKVVTIREKALEALNTSNITQNEVE
ncbi:MAG: outer membrane protein assembly factor BamD [Bacteroidales bacterium]|nr:outer membrane protein assembly factor BamD [Bacteroidales bacterium]